MKGKKKIMLGIPFHKVLTEPRFQLAITNLAFTLNQRGYDVDVNYKEGTVISSQRNSLAEDAIEVGYDLVQLDTDMEFSPPDVMKVIECDIAPVIGGLYFASRKPYYPLVFDEDFIETEGNFRSYAIGDIPKEPWIVKGVAIGVSKIELDTLKYFFDDARIKKFYRPFNFWQLDNGREIGEDLSFCHRCNLEEIPMACVPDVELIHLGKRRIRKQDHLFAIQQDFHYANDIRGWMNVREQNWLYQHAKKFKSIIEIGSWKGKSTHALCCGCAEGHVTAIDHFVGTDDPIQEKYRAELYRGAFKEVEEGVDIYEIFKKNMACFNNLDVIKMGSQDAIKKYPGLGADMIFIDGGHNYDEVMADLKAYEPRAKKIICGHDYSARFPQVVGAVNDYFKEKGLRKEVQSYETIFWVEKEPLS